MERGRPRPQGLRKQSQTLFERCAFIADEGVRAPLLIQKNRAAESYEKNNADHCIGRKKCSVHF